MHSQRLKWSGRHVGVALSTLFLAGAVSAQAQSWRNPLVITSTNDPSANSVVVFKLNTAGTPSLSLSESFHTGGKGGASTNAGILQFKDNLGAVANYGSNTVSQLARFGRRDSSRKDHSARIGLRETRFGRPDRLTALRRRCNLRRIALLASRLC